MPPSTTQTISTTGQEARCATISTPSSASKTVRTTSQVIIVNRRSSRSDSAPAGSWTQKMAIDRTVPTTPASTAEWVSARISSG